MKVSPLTASLITSLLVLPACQSEKHTMVEPKEGTVVACKECYTEVYKAQHPSGSRWSGSAAGPWR